MKDEEVLLEAKIKRDLMLLDVQQELGELLNKIKVSENNNYDLNDSTSFADDELEDIKNRVDVLKGIATTLNILNTYELKNKASDKNLDNKLTAISKQISALDIDAFKDVSNQLNEEV
jgi:hypothetical protein